MKKIFNYFILFTLSALIITPAFSQEMKVGIVDMNRVFGEYHKTKETEKEIESQSIIENRIAKLEKDIRQNAFDSFVKILERSLSTLPFLCLIPAQCECPAINYILFSKYLPTTIGSTFFANPVL